MSCLWLPFYSLNLNNKWASWKFRRTTSKTLPELSAEAWYKMLDDIEQRDFTRVIVIYQYLLSGRHSRIFFLSPASLDLWSTVYCSVVNEVMCLDILDCVVSYGSSLVSWRGIPDSWECGNACFYSWKLRWKGQIYCDFNREKCMTLELWWYRVLTL